MLFFGFVVSHGRGNIRGIRIFCKTIFAAINVICLYSLIWEIVVGESQISTKSPELRA